MLHYCKYSGKNLFYIRVMDFTVEKRPKYSMSVNDKCRVTRLKTKNIALDKKTTRLYARKLSPIISPRNLSDKSQ